MSVGVLAVLLVVLLLFMRLRQRYRLRHNREILHDFSSAYSRLLATGENTLSLPPPRDYELLLYDWNKRIGNSEGLDRERIFEVGRSLGMADIALRMIRSGNIRRRLLGVTTLGHLRESAAWEPLLKLARHSNSTLSLTAARALNWIDPERGTDAVLELLLDRGDWAWSSTAHVLGQAPAELVCEKLNQAIPGAPVQKQASMLRFMEVLDCVRPGDVVTGVLQTSEDDHVISTCLHIIRDPAALPEIRKYVKSVRWHVRMHAATALGRLGKADDFHLLSTLTMDHVWWVRYRAAQALVSLPGVSNEKIETFLGMVPDPWSKDIIIQAISEAKKG